METIKCGSTGQYCVAAAIISYLDEKETYEGILYLQEAKKKAKYFASDIRIFSQKKETVYKQLKSIAALYPPKTDINILDLEGNI